MEAIHRGRSSEADESPFTHWVSACFWGGSPVGSNSGFECLIHGLFNLKKNKTSYLDVFLRHSVGQNKTNIISRISRWSVPAICVTYKHGGTFHPVAKQNNITSMSTNTLECQHRATSMSPTLELLKSMPKKVGYSWVHSFHRNVWKTLSMFIPGIKVCWRKCCVEHCMVCRTFIENGFTNSTNQRNKQVADAMFQSNNYNCNTCFWGEVSPVLGVYLLGTNSFSRGSNPPRTVLTSQSLHIQLPDITTTQKKQVHAVPCWSIAQGKHLLFASAEHHHALRESCVRMTWKNGPNDRWMESTGKPFELWVSKGTHPNCQPPLSQNKAILNLIVNHDF